LRKNGEVLPLRLRVVGQGIGPDPDQNIGLEPDQEVDPRIQNVARTREGIDLFLEACPAKNVIEAANDLVPEARPCLT
jgi:hypothetical protein